MVEIYIYQGNFIYVSFWSSVALLDSKLFKYFEGLDTASALATITKEKFI